MLILNEVQDVTTVCALHRVLLDAIQPGSACTVDMSAVAQADLSFVQLIEAARRHAETLGGSLALAAAAPPGVIDLLTQAGFADPGQTAFWTHGVLQP